MYIRFALMSGHFFIAIQDNIPCMWRAVRPCYDVHTCNHNIIIAHTKALIRIATISRMLGVIQPCPAQIRERFGRGLVFFFLRFPESSRFRSIQHIHFYTIVSVIFFLSVFAYSRTSQFIIERWPKQLLLGS